MSSVDQRRVKYARDIIKVFVKVKEMKVRGSHVCKIQSKS